MHKGSVLMRRVRCQDTTDHLQTCIAQSLQTTTSHPRVGIRERHDNPLDPSGQNCLGARRRPAVMTTGLESDNDRASARHRTGLRQSSWLSMRLPGPGMKPLSHQAAGCIQHNSPHQRVRAGAPCAQGGQLQRPPHPGNPALFRLGQIRHQLNGSDCTSRHSATT